MEINEHCTISPLSIEEIPEVIRYFRDSDSEVLKKRGIDATKLPLFEEWYDYMLSEHEKPLTEKNYFCLGWRYDDQLIGHSCIDHIEFGEQAFTHLHIWKPEFRHMKLGRSLFWLSLQYYFKHFNLKRIYCQPNANNNEPNRVLNDLGFELVKNYKTIPHPICFEQYVNLYVVDRKNFENLPDKKRIEI